MTIFPVTMLRVLYTLHRHRPHHLSGGQKRRRRSNMRSVTRIFVFEGGGCDGCAMEMAGLKMGFSALEAEGFTLVLRPEEADWLVVTGSVTRLLVPDLHAAWQLMPEERCLIALGDCAINGGIFTENYASFAGLEKLSQTSIPLPGCPPTPQSIMEGFSAIKAHLSHSRP